MIQNLIMSHELLCFELIFDLEKIPLSHNWNGIGLTLTVTENMLPFVKLI